MFNNSKVVKATVSGALAAAVVLPLAAPALAQSAIADTSSNGDPFTSLEIKDESTGDLTVGEPETPVTDPVVLAADPDVDETPYMTPVTVSVLGNDTMSENATRWYSVHLKNDRGLSVKTLKVNGEGTYVVNDDMTITFTPLEGFTGEATPVTYQAKDDKHLIKGVTSTLTITVGGMPAIPLDPAPQPEEPETPVDPEPEVPEEPEVPTDPEPEVPEEPEVPIEDVPVDPETPVEVEPVDPEPETPVDPEPEVPEEPEVPTDPEPEVPEEPEVPIEDEPVDPEPETPVTDPVVDPEDTDIWGKPISCEDTDQLNDLVSSGMGDLPVIHTLEGRVSANDYLEGCKEPETPVDPEPEVPEEPETPVDPETPVEVVDEGKAVPAEPKPEVPAAPVAEDSPITKVEDAKPVMVKTGEAVKESGGLWAVICGSLIALGGIIPTIRRRMK